MPAQRIEQLELSKVTINGIEVLREYISLIEIYESLQQPGITGMIHLMDFQGIQELGNIAAGDDIVISFSVIDKKNKAIEATFKIYSNEGNKVLPGNSYDVTCFGFCSPWMIAGLTKKVSKNYTDKFIHEIVKDLLETAGASINFIEPTKQKLDIFVTPLWTPYHSIKHLLSFALNTSDKAGYLCWTDLRTGKVNVTTLDYLLKGTLGKFSQFMVYPANQRYEGKINDLTFESSFNLVRQLNAGISHSHIGFNFDQGKHLIVEDSHGKLDYTHLSKKFPIPNSYLTDKSYNFPKFTAIYPQSKDPIKGDARQKDLISGIANNEHTFLAVDTLKINIIAPGEPERRVGWLATVDFPSQNVNAGDKTGYKQLKGDYLIRDIKHSFSFHVEYKQAITLISDGYKEHTRDLVTWG